jgi:hypothetical protein
MTWLDDPSSLVSKRRRVGEFQGDMGQLKLAHRLKKAQAAIVDTSFFWLKKAQHLIWNLSYAAAKKYAKCQMC